MSGSVSFINGHIDDDVQEMTPQEAKSWFEEDLKDGKCSDDCPDCNAMELAILALEKQIPKKPTKYMTDRYCCPVCKAIRYSSAPYCEHCGQALDWSDTE